MDILKPELIWIENRCYRKLPILDGEKNVYHEEDLYPSNSYEYKNEEEEDDCKDLPVSHEGDQFWISITIPGPLIGMVKGKYDRTKKNIEESTTTSIKIPNNRDNQNRKYHQTREENSVDAVIKGSNRNLVCKAYRRIESIIIDGRWKVGNFTHFLSLPVNNESIKKGYLEFKKDILNNFKSVRGISNELFEFPTTLHLTVVMLTLFNDKEKEDAKHILNNCREDILKLLGGNKLQIQVKGIEYMNDDPAEVDVLYGKVREKNDDNFLQIITDTMADRFISSKFARREYDAVKLHVTLMKSRKREENFRFDARPLLKKYSEYPFGEMTLSEIHISTRYTGSDKEYYKPVCFVTL